MNFRDLIARDPSLKPPSIFDDMQNLFGEYSTFPLIEVTEDETRFTIEAELAGMAAENIDITVSDGALAISGEKREETNGDDKNYFRREISYGSFCRVIALPTSADLDAAKASFNEGSLTVEVPKKSGAKRNSRKVPVGKN